MKEINEQEWIILSPPFRGSSAHLHFTKLAKTLTKVPNEKISRDAFFKKQRIKISKAVLEVSSKSKQHLLAASFVLVDLAAQGWRIRIRKNCVMVHPPSASSGGQGDEKDRIRAQELIKRDAQLCKPSVRIFVNKMESPRLFGGKFVSIFSLMRDGRELAKTLRLTRDHLNNGWAEALEKSVDPYLQVITSEKSRCEHTGLRLMDVWRYFRHTWSSQHSSTPGRGMLFLVRDRAAENHPVMGIGALSSPIVQIRQRDIWIGWHSDKFLSELLAKPTTSSARWLQRITDAAIAELYIDDLVEDGILSARDVSKPTELVIQKLLADGTRQRSLHHRYARARDLKDLKGKISEPEFWVGRARTHLFRSKRSLALASYLRIRLALSATFQGRPTATKLKALLASGYGRDLVKGVVRKAKSDRVGIAMADISVCGAVQPYNAILGGKLVAMLSASPEIAAAYKRRYKSAVSEIASAMSGKPVVRASDLVLFCTTSLYGVGSSQYNRVKIPCERIGGQVGESLSYEELGHSEAFGTSHYSEETIDALVDLVQQSAGGQRVNSIFGEGVSPKLRKVRAGLDLLEFPAERLLRHHRRRIVYAISLVGNLKRYLLGMEDRPKYLLPMSEGRATTQKIASWWRERWLKNRILSDNVLSDVERHTLVRPVTHGARVILPQIDEPTLLQPRPFQQLTLNMD